MSDELKVMSYNFWFTSYYKLVTSVNVLWCKPLKPFHRKTDLTFKFVQTEEKAIIRLNLWSKKRNKSLVQKCDWTLQINKRFCVCVFAFAFLRYTFLWLTPIPFNTNIHTWMHKPILNFYSIYFRSQWMNYNHN